MNDDFDIRDYIDGSEIKTRYEKHIQKIQEDGKTTDSIEKAVNGAIDNIQKHQTRSFVIYGEPQSGKTEMMIALTAKLLDEGRKIIVILLNDSVQLLEQNLDRFLRSGLDPAPKTFNDIRDPSVKIGDGRWVIFSKKNSGDLKKLLEKIETEKDKVIIDDEADFATPNSKINQVKKEKTRINELVGRLLGNDGTYVGVTATPARLDLNNTFENNNEKWIDFPPHPAYTGQDIFFPTSNQGFDELKFKLRLLPDEHDDPKYMRKALFGFLVNVAFFNSSVNEKSKNYCMLVHTSGKKSDHEIDYKQIIKCIGILKNKGHKLFEKYLREIYDIAKKEHSGQEKNITRYIVEHIGQNDIVVMNSDADKKTTDYKRATSPSSVFTIAIGGNIVSRGVTFDNLLCMFFTRDVKQRIQQDTYIQRARMFGSRNEYLRHFELHIPEKLYLDWQKCFVFHRLSLSFIHSGKGSPIWLEDKRVSAAASSSIDKATVSFDSGEMSWDLFEYSSVLDEVVVGSQPSEQKLKELAKVIGENGLPNYVIQFIDEFSPQGSDSVAIHKTTEIGEDYASADTKRIIRSRGFMSTGDLEKEKYPKAIHHIKIFKNSDGNARIFYKYMPDMGSIKFLKKLKAR